jgi:HAD superfamily hydrolase (TIGR01509 family)
LIRYQGANQKRVHIVFDAVIFDLDGTLIDTERLAMAATVAAFGALGLAADMDFLNQLVGQDTPTGERLIAARYPALDLADFDRRVSTAMHQELRFGMPLKPGVRELLAQIPHSKAIATSSSRIRAVEKVEQAGLTTDFNHLITLDDVTRAKPAPDPYLLAAQLLGVAPARCLVFEDSEIGAEAAHAAGMRVVQVPDIVPSKGRFAHHLAKDLLSGARAAGLI